MGKIRTSMAALLTMLAFSAFQSDAFAQARSTRTTSETRSTGGSVSRSTVSQDRKVTVTKPSTSQSKPSTQTRPSTQTKPSSQTRPSTATRPSGNSSAVKIDKNERKPSTTVQRPTSTRPVTADRPSSTRPSSTTTRPSTTNKPTVTRPSNSGTRPSGNVSGNNKSDKPVTVTRPGNRTDRGDRPENRPSDGRPSVRPDGGRGGQGVRPDRDRPPKPVQIRPDHKPEVHRVHPRDRDFMDYDRPSRFWASHNHCFGHRVRILPAHARRHVHLGVTYYCYNDIWYRPYGGYYVVCRPPFGTVLAANLISDMTWAAVRLSYYYTVANTYRQINENNEYIAEQNAVIAQNNATIAAQNQAIAMNQQLASQAYALANELGLVQSYAAADSSYYYQDGVFYAMDADGEYKVIVPPAGALVESLPEDYDIVNLNGDDYYKVDDTVYKVTISEGKPYFEVLGQLYA